MLAAVGLQLPSTPRRALVSLLAARARVRLRGLVFPSARAADLPAADLARIDTCWSVAVGLGMVDTIRGGDFQARHLLLALRAGEPYRIARALAFEACFSATPASPRTRAPRG